MRRTWLDRTIGFVSPRREFDRLRARMAVDLMTARSYEGAGGGRRFQGWKRSGADAAQSTGPFLALLRDRARDLVRNNPHATSALRTIAQDTVSWGIVAKPKKANKRAQDVWEAWSDSTDCDADGRNNFYGLQQLVMRTVAESGEVLIRRRLRNPDDGFAIPMQLQVLEPDFLDMSKDSIGLLPGGFRIIQGVEYNPIGQRVAYWLYPEHPGSAFATPQSVRVPAESVLHIFEALRPGQVRGPSWFSPVLLRFKDFDDYEDATLVKQKVAACLAAFVTGDDPSNPALGGDPDDTRSPGIDGLEPGAINYLPAGADVKFLEPPTVREYGDYSNVSLHAIAVGLGVPYESLTGDYGDLPFSAVRAMRIDYQKRLDSWRWQMLIPQFCQPVWGWAMEVAAIFGAGLVGGAYWTAAPMPMVDPVNEGIAYMRNVRAGIMTLSEALRERGYDPMDVFDEMKRDYDEMDKRGIIVDSDARKMTQAGQLQGEAAAPAAQPAAPDDLAAAAARLRLAGGGRR